MSPQQADKSPSIEAQDRRILALRRAFQRQLSHKPTTLQRTHIDAAAIMQARFEAAALDPSTTHNDLVRLSGEARRSRIIMLASFTKRDPGDYGVIELDRFLADDGGAPAW